MTTMVHASAEPVDIVLANWPSKFKKTWEELETHGTCLPFQRYAWAHLWCELRAEHLQATPCIAQLSCAGKPLCILPLAMRQHQGKRIVEFLGNEYNDYNAPILAPGAQLNAEMLEQVLHSLPPHDRVELRKLLIGEQAKGLLGPYTSEDTEVGHKVPLFESQTWQRAAVQKSEKKIRKLSAEGSLEFIDVTEDRGMFDLLHHWKQKQFPGYLEEPHKTFYRRLLQTDVAQLYALRIKGAVVAIYLVVFSGPMCIGLITGYDIEQRTESPGRLLLVMLMERMRDEGFKYFDLGGGAEAYKQDYAPGWETLYTYRRSK